MFRAEMSKIKVKKGRKKSASQILKDLKEEWSSFSLTDENRVKSIETESLGIIKEEKHGYELKVHRVGFGYGKSIKVSDIDVKGLVDEIYFNYIVDLEEEEYKLLDNEIGYVLEYWTVEYQRLWSGYLKLEDAKSVLMKELCRVQDDIECSDWMLLLIDIQEKVKKVKIKPKPKVKPKPKKKVFRRSGRPIVKHEYILDFRKFLRIRGRVGKARLKVFKNLWKSYHNYRFSLSLKDHMIVKDLTLKLVGIYYIRKTGLRLKVVDKRFIRTRYRRNRKVYRYSRKYMSYK